MLKGGSERRRVKLRAAIAALERDDLPVRNRDGERLGQGADLMLGIGARDDVGSSSRHGHVAPESRAECLRQGEFRVARDIGLEHDRLVRRDERGDPSKRIEVGGETLRQRQASGRRLGGRCDDASAAGADPDRLQEIDIGVLDRGQRADDVLPTRYHQRALIVQVEAGLDRPELLFVSRGGGQGTLGVDENAGRAIAQILEVGPPAVGAGPGQSAGRHRTGALCGRATGSWRCQSKSS
jgi:hypothetical protein